MGRLAGGSLLVAEACVGDIAQAVIAHAELEIGDEVIAVGGNEGAACVAAGKGCGKPIPEHCGGIVLFVDKMLADVAAGFGAGWGEGKA